MADKGDIERNGVGRDGGVKGKGKSSWKMRKEG